MFGRYRLDSGYLTGIDAFYQATLLISVGLATVVVAVYVVATTFLGRALQAALEQAEASKEEAKRHYQKTKEDLEKQSSLPGIAKTLAKRSTGRKSPQVSRVSYNRPLGAVVIGGTPYGYRSWSELRSYGGALCAHARCLQGQLVVTPLGYEWAWAQQVTLLDAAPA